jgi:AraC family transcriptional regulator
MDPVQKALWFVESHMQEPMALEDIAGACKVSPFHLTRAFAAAMGLSLMRYVRGRRLSESARRLMHGADDILRVALDAGYGSHEAFSRAFRDQFGLTPEQVRTQGDLANVQLLEAIAMSTMPLAELTPPRFEVQKGLLLAGLIERYDCQAPQGIPNQWQQFVPYLGNIPGQVGKTTYGVSFHFDSDSNFDYVSGVEVSDERELPAGLEHLRIGEQRYAVFTHAGHVAGIRSTCMTIWSKWFPESGHQPANAPMIERYGESFNGLTGLGGLEIWVPIQG